LDQTFTRIDQTIALGALFTAHHLNHCSFDWLWVNSDLDESSQYSCAHFCVDL
jgi:hypothetical protein